MLTQLFKMMWHRKGRNLLLLIEIFFSFLVLFATGTLLFKNLTNYYTPIGFDYADVYELSMDRHGEANDTSLQKLKQMQQQLQSKPEFAAFAFSSSNTPFSYSTWNTTLLRGDKSVTADQYYVSKGYFDTYDLSLLEGRWLQHGDLAEVKNVVINQTLADYLFPDGEAVGQVIGEAEDGPQYRVVGVIAHYRQDGEFDAPREAFFTLFDEQLEAFPENGNLPSSLLLEVKAGVDPGWQEEIIKSLGHIAGSWTLELRDVPKMRESKGRNIFIPTVILSIVCGFLIFNVALGLFGVLWYNISKRYAEIGIRRALGASRGAIRLQMLGEVLVLATLALSLGVVMAVQFPLLGVFNVASTVYVAAMAGALFIIYLLVFLCAWYPSRQAANIEPAMALHYE